MQRILWRFNSFITLTLLLLSTAQCFLRNSICPFSFNLLLYPSFWFCYKRTCGAAHRVWINFEMGCDKKCSLRSEEKTLIVFLLMTHLWLSIYSIPQHAVACSPPCAAPCKSLSIFCIHRKLTTSHSIALKNLLFGLNEIYGWIKKQLVAETDRIGCSGAASFPPVASDNFSNPPQCVFCVQRDRSV